MNLYKENNRITLEDKFDTWVAKFMTDAYYQMNEVEYTKFCSNIEDILAQYTDPYYFSDMENDNNIIYDDDESWFNESYSRGDLVKFDLGRKRNDFHNGIITKIKNGKYTVRDENGDNVEISDEMIIEKLEQMNESVDTMPKRFFPDFDLTYDDLSYLKPTQYYSGPYKYKCSTYDEDGEEFDIVENTKTGEYFYTNI